MKAEKIRNLTDAELRHQESDLADQLFKLKFQMNMGQTESLKKIRGLRKDIARVKTILREQELAGRDPRTTIIVTHHAPSSQSLPTRLRGQLLTTTLFPGTRGKMGDGCSQIGKLG